MTSAPATPVLSHLKSLPVDMLKIDAGFVRELGTNAGDLAIVRAIIDLLKPSIFNWLRRGPKPRLPH